MLPCEGKEFCDLRGSASGTPGRRYEMHEQGNSRGAEAQSGRPAHKPTFSWDADIRQECPSSPRPIAITEHPGI